MTLHTDTWVTLEQANTYFSTRIGASFWALMSNEEKETLLVSAFNWLLYDASLELSADTDNTDVRIAQLESAYFLNKHYMEYEEREAAQAGGVTSVTSSKWSESYASMGKPARVLSALQRAGAYCGGGTMIALGASE